MAWINDRFDQLREARVISKKKKIKVKFSIQRNFGEGDDNVGLKSGLRGVFKFLKYSMVIEFLNDPNGLTLDFILLKLFEV